MILEEKNKEKRKTIPLTSSEALTFFFIPFAFFGIDKFRKNDFNQSEMERFKAYGFDLKVKQANELTIYGRIFYIAITIIIIYLIQVK
ncbi:hypothetical protein FBALC1_06268 [Flavobacteriales bacterium ALC-1]|nr:hypothetical protein FBALC1_06268 [Flavobacteriales bacterium ALC-1]